LRRAAPRGARRAEREPRPRGRRGTAAGACRAQGAARDGGHRGAPPLDAPWRRQAARHERGHGAALRAARGGARAAHAALAQPARARRMSEDREIRRIVVSGVLVMAGGAAALAAWAAYAPVSGAVIAPGFVKVDLNRKVVQHQEGGTVRAVRVRDGERVKQGQELVTLDDVRVDSALDLQRTQLDAERAKAARLEAERAFAAKPVFPADLVKRGNEPKMAEQLARESVLFRARRDALDTQIVLLRKQIDETGAEVVALNEQLAAEERALKLQKEELTANEGLLAQGYVQKTRIMTLQRATAEYEARHGERRAELAKSRQRTAVVGPREVLMEIVPDDKRLIVEARIRPEDINHVRAGSQADVRLTAYQQRTTPLVPGTVIYVSGDRLVEQQTGTPYYVVQIDVPAEALAEAGHLKLQAGMPAE